MKIIKNNAQINFHCVHVGSGTDFPLMWLWPMKIILAVKMN